VYKRKGSGVGGGTIKIKKHRNKENERKAKKDEGISGMKVDKEVLETTDVPWEKWR